MASVVIQYRIELILTKDTFSYSVVFFHWVEYWLKCKDKSSRINVINMPWFWNSEHNWNNAENKIKIGQHSNHITSPYVCIYVIMIIW